MHGVLVAGVADDTVLIQHSGVGHSDDGAGGNGDGVAICILEHMIQAEGRFRDRARMLPMRRRLSSSCRRRSSFSSRSARWFCCRA